MSPEPKPKVSAPGIGPQITPAGGSYVLPPLGKRLFGDMQTDMARTAAINKRNAVGQRYNNANFAFGQDITNYNTANTSWDAKKGGMTQADFDACYGHLLACYNAIAAENNALTSAYGHIATGDTSIDYGDNPATAPPPPAEQRTPLQWYQNAIQHFDIADNPNCVTAETQHTTFAGHLTQANTILAKYP